MATKTWNAQSYNDNSQLQYLASKEFFNTLQLEGSEAILDIGCGTGLLTSEISKLNPLGKVIGIDSSESMITYANGNWQSPNLEFIKMRAEELNFPHTFNIIISSFCLHWVKGKQSLFHNIAKHLKPDGLTRLIMPFRHEEIAKIRSNIMGQNKWAHYFNANDNCRNY